MPMLIKHAIRFSLKTSKTGADKRPGRRDYPIRMRICYNALRIDVPINIGVYKKDWNAEQGCAIARFETTAQGEKVERAINSRNNTASDINNLILEYTLFAHEVIKAYEVQHVVPSPQDLRHAIRASIASRVIDISGKTHDKTTMHQVFSMFKEENGAKNAWTQSTYEKFDSLWIDLTSFKKDISFRDLDEKGLTEFVTFLRDEKVVRPEKRDLSGHIIQEAVIGLKNSTIEKKLGYLAWFLNWATLKGYNEIQDYKSFKPKLKTTQQTVIFLTQPEIQQLCDFSIPEDKRHLEKVRDVFVFCCFTGLRFSDAKNLKKGDVKSDFFDLTTVKTADTLRIEFNSVSRAILDKYKDFPLPNDCALPVISNQKMNEELKELCRMAGIDSEIRKTFYRGNERIDERYPKYEVVSTHTGRKSFICNALALGIPVDVVMKWTGHADYNSMKPYIAVADEIKVREMAKFNASDIRIS